MSSAYAAEDWEPSIPVATGPKVCVPALPVEVIDGQKEVVTGVHSEDSVRARNVLSEDCSSEARGKARMTQVLNKIETVDAATQSICSIRGRKRKGVDLGSQMVKRRKTQDSFMEEVVEHRQAGIVGSMEPDNDSGGVVHDAL